MTDDGWMMDAGCWMMDDNDERHRQLNVSPCPPPAGGRTPLTPAKPPFAGVRHRQLNVSAPRWREDPLDDDDAWWMIDDG